MSYLTDLCGEFKKLQDKVYDTYKEVVIIGIEFNSARPSTLKSIVDLTIIIELNYIIISTKGIESTRLSILFSVDGGPITQGNYDSRHKEYEFYTKPSCKFLLEKLEPLFKDFIYKAGKTVNLVI